MQRDRSTLFTSPVSLADFVFRLAFFSIAPFAIVGVAELFPVRGALIDVALALGVFVAGEAARRWAARFRALKLVIAEALTFEGFYRERMPRPFAYYFFYPVLFPYWLSNREARREFLVFRSYTVGSFLVLVLTLAWQYHTSWRPELGFRDFLPYVGLSLAVETLLVLSLLMPIATTVVWYHSSFRRGRLAVVLLAGLVSTSVVLAHVANRKRPIVSYATRERVRLRTERVPRTAHRTLVRAARAAWRKAVTMKDLTSDRRMDDGELLDVARDQLAALYKNDEAFAFDVWASPLRNSGALVLFFEARGGKPPIWVGIGPDGGELKKRADLPRGAARALRRSEKDTDAIPVWPEDIDLAGP